jgi:hypothetical protein
MPNLPELIGIFVAVLELVSRPDNEFGYSGWNDASDARQEIDEILRGLAKGEIPRVATVMFLPTGPLQELGTSSGWGDEFLELADQFDVAMSTSCESK